MSPGWRHSHHLRGDIGTPDIVPALRRIAPITAIRGSTDKGEWANESPDTKLVQLAGVSIYVLHDLNALQIDPFAHGINVVISGHSHAPKIRTIDGVALRQPWKRRSTPLQASVTLATIDIGPGGLRPIIHDLRID